jgi:hypothetical protein
MKEELDRYKVESDPFWKTTWPYGDFGVIEIAEAQGWQAIPSWGRDSYDLGSWPFAIVFFRDQEDTFDVVEYVEGDVTQWSCPTEEIRQAITDELAFLHWKHNGRAWVKDFDNVDQLPDELRGPFRNQ